MKKTRLIKRLSTGILIFINLFFSACSTTSEHSVPVEERAITNKATPQDVKTKSSVITDTETELEPTESGAVIKDSRHEKSVSEQSSSPVALAFMKDADKYTTAGDSDRAIASLERGLDIEPKNPWLWNRLASERLKQKMWNKAITLAKKSNAFASGHNQLQKDNWQIISEARTALGDREGARKADKMIERFSTGKT